MWQEIQTQLATLDGLAGLNMAQWQMLIALGCVLLAVLVVMYSALARSGTQRQHQVLQRFQQRRLHRHATAVESSLADYLSWLPVTEKDRAELGLLLSQAGFRDVNAIPVLVALKLAGLLLLPLLVWLGAEGGFTLGLLAKMTVAALFGSMTPEWWLKRRARHNQEQLRSAVPDAIDLMVICAESGLHIDAILHQVAGDIRDWSSILADELEYTHAQIQMGTDRYQALRGLALRTEVEELEHLVSALVQADQYGTPLVKALRDLARESRRLHLLNVEERIGKIPATISLPLMLFVLIPLVILLAGPSMVLLVRSLREL